MTVNEKILLVIKDRQQSHNQKRNGKLRWSIEYGRGETYSNAEITLYGHDRYERGSVLYGRTRRMWIASFGTGPEAEQDARDTVNAAKIMRNLNWMVGGGSSHVPIEQVVSHLPDDTDY